MTDQTPITGTALALAEPTALAAIIRNPKQVDAVIDQMRAEVRSHVPDLTTVKGRDAIKSLAYKVSRSKTAFDDAGKSVTEVARKEIALVDAERRKIREALDALRDEARKPLTDWEAAEEKRIAALKLRLGAFRPASVPASSEGLRALIAEIEAVTVDASWAEFQTEAAEAKAMCLNRLDEHLAAAVEREEMAREQARKDAELEQLRRKMAEREEADRLAREAAEAEARRIEAERVEAERRAAAEKAEAERAARIEAEKQEAARVAAEQAEARAKAEAERQAKEAAEREAAMEREKAAAEERHKRELAEAKAREEAAAQRERDRIAAEQKAAADAKAKREADQAHRARIRDDIATSLNAFCDESAAVMIADAIMAGQIAHVEARV